MGLKHRHAMQNVMIKKIQLRLLKLMEIMYLVVTLLLNGQVKVHTIKIQKQYLFSVRRKGISCNHKFMKNESNYAIRGYPRYGPIFGGGGGCVRDIFIKDKSDLNIGIYTDLGRGYHYPSENWKWKVVFSRKSKQMVNN
jgi:hypothetical protein